MDYLQIRIGDSVIIEDCRHIHNELHEGAGGRIVGEADDNGEYLVDFWSTRKRIPPSKFKQLLPKQEVTQPTIEVDMSNVVLNIKKNSPIATLPKYMQEGDCGMDLVAISCSLDEYGNYVYDTGIAIKVPEGHMGLLMARSSISKYDLVLSNSLGLIDKSYTGSLIFKFKPLKDKPKVYSVGDRIGQLVIAPCATVTLNQVDELEKTARGQNGFGSSGV
jgi:dUTP pyrophosphatase